MCYAKPGPRCSKHTSEALAAAIATGDTEKIAKAQDEYNRTPAGIKELRAAGENVLARRYEKERSQAIQGYKEGRWDANGFNEYGVHKDTGTFIDNTGYTRSGRDREGYDREGYNQWGYDRNGFDRDGYNRAGCDKNGYERNGFTGIPSDEGGYTMVHRDTGTDRDPEGYDYEGYRADGFNRDGIHRETGTKHAPATIEEVMALKAIFWH